MVALLAALVTASVPLLVHVFSPGLQATVDWNLHACWATGFAEALFAGVLDPQWLDAANGGYGAPVFVFYPQFAYYLAAPVVVSLGAESGLKALSIVACMCAGGGTFVWLRPTAGTKWAIVAACIAMLLPQLLWPSVRFNMPAQTLALGLASFAFAAWERSVRGGNFGFALLAVACALVFATHLPSALMIGAVFGFLGSWQFARRRQIARTTLSLGAVCLGALLSARAWLTALLQLPEVHWSHLRSPQWRIESNLLFSHEPMLAFPAEATAMEFIAVATLLWLGISLMVASVVSRVGARDLPEATVPWALLAGLLFAMGSVLSGPLHLMVPGLDLMQFGWRWHGMFALAAIRAAIPLAPFCASAGWKMTARLPAVATAAFSFAAWFTSTGLTYGIGELGLHQLDRATHDQIEWASQACPWDTLEHRPRSMGATWRRDARSDRRAIVEINRGRGRLLELDASPGRRVYAFDIDYPAEVRLRLLFYPGWRATAGEREYTLSHDRTGAVLFHLEPGHHRVALTFDANPGVKTGRMVGGSALCIFALLLAFEARLGRRGSCRLRDAAEKPAPASQDVR